MPRSGCLVKLSSSHAWPTSLLEPGGELDGPEERFLLSRSAATARERPAPPGRRPTPVSRPPAFASFRAFRARKCRDEEVQPFQVAVLLGLVRRSAGSRRRTPTGWPRPAAWRPAGGSARPARLGLGGLGLEPGDGHFRPSVPDGDHFAEHRRRGPAVAPYPARAGATSRLRRPGTGDGGPRGRGWSGWWPAGAAAARPRQVVRSRRRFRSPYCWPMDARCTSLGEHLHLGGRHALGVVRHPRQAAGRPPGSADC